MNKFSENLKLLRTDKNISQQKLASDLSLSKAIISMWESSQREPTLTNLISLANYFDVSLDYLCGRKEF